MAIKVNKDMTIGQILEIDRRTAPLFMEFGMHCFVITSYSIHYTKLYDNIY